jgi:superfamily II DNA or RNA helicase
MLKPYKWQESAVARFVKEAFFCQWVDCGCGKTLAGILIALRKKLPAIIIAPGHLLCDQWKKELIESGVAEEDIWVYNRNEERRQEAEYRAAYEAWIKQADQAARAAQSARGAHETGA